MEQPPMKMRQTGVGVAKVVKKASPKSRVVGQRQSDKERTTRTERPKKNVCRTVAHISH